MVGDDWDGFTDDAVADLVAGIPNGSIHTVHLNSPGGTIYQGLAVYNQLKAKQPKRVVIDGLAASMGSVIALAGERLEMTKGSMLMIHNPWNIALGDAREMRKTAEILDKFKASLLGIYAERTGHELDVLSDMMDEETWLTADEAVEWGFAHAVLEGEANVSALNLEPLSDTKNMPAHIKSLMLAQSSLAANPPAAEAAIPEPQEVTEMSNNTATPSAAENTVDTEVLNKAREDAAAAAVAAERKRVHTIREYVAAAAGVEASFGEKLIEDGLSEGEAKAAVDRLAAYLAENTSAPTSHTTIEVTRDER
ncbi:MAG: head maturation protease, ClpP-related, partial [Wenzhouxiangella sp.]